MAFRLVSGELNILFLLLTVALTTFYLQDSRNAASVKSRAIALLGVSAFTAALFYKEVVFTIGLAFGASEFLRYYRNNRVRPPNFILAIFIASIVYIVSYLLWRLYFVTGSYASFHATSVVRTMIRFVYSDPFLMLVTLPIAAYRMRVIAVHPEQHRLQDSFLIAASIYVISFLALSMFNYYYLLPAYAFAVPGVAGFLFELRNAKVARSILLVTLISSLSTLPLSVSDLQTQRLTSNNHYQFVKFMADWLKHKDEGSSRVRHLVLAGVSPGSGVEIIYSLKTYLTSLGVPENHFDIQATEPTDNVTISSFFNVAKVDGYSPRPNDLLIFNPYQRVNIRPPARSPSNREIYRSDTEFTLPRWSGWQWARNCIIQPQNCSSKIQIHKRYAGYSAFIISDIDESPPSH